VVDGTLGAQQQQQQGDQSLRLRLAGLQQRAPRSPEDTRAYVRPGVPLRDVLAEDAQPAHLQLAKRLLSWSLDEFRVRPQRQQRLQLSGAGGKRMSQPRAAVMRGIGSGRLQQAKFGRLQGTGAQSAWTARGRSQWQWDQMESAVHCLLSLRIGMQLVALQLPVACSALNPRQLASLEGN